MNPELDNAQESRAAGWPESPRARAAVALVFVVVCLVLWRIWVLPTFQKSVPTIPPPAEPVSLDGMHLRGSARAPVGLIVFSDFQCPFCRSFARNVLPEIARRYVPDGRVVVAFSDFPLVSIHPAALRRAVIAECAGRQGRFWEVHDVLFAGQTRTSVEKGAVQGLDANELSQCMASTGEPAVRARLVKAEALGIRSTPSIFVGKMEGGRLTVTDVILGVQSVDSLSRVIDRLLGGGK